MATARRIDLRGKIFDHLAVLSFHHVNSHGTTYWLCQCDCGKQTIVSRNHLIDGSTHSCGHLKGEDNDLTGHRFGKLIVLQSAGRNHRGNRLWECLCECGTVKIIQAAKLKERACQSCGCLRIVHGLCKDPIYSQWYSMIDRCYREAAINYNDYGAKGIKVCEFLRASPANVLILLGARPDSMSIDRIQNDAGYYCGQCSECLANGWQLNVKWANIFQQNQNRSNTHWIDIDGERQCVSEWARRLNISRKAVVKQYGTSTSK